MQVSLENTGSIGRKMTVTIPAESMETRVAEKLASMSRSMRLPGFRPGKAPRKLIEAKYGKQVVLEVAEQMISEGYRNALGEEKVVPAGSPRIEATRIERGEDLEFVAEFDVFPEVVRSDLGGEDISRPVCEISEEDVDRTVQSLRERQTEWDESTAAAEDGNKITIDFTGTIDGEPFDGGSASDFEVTLGSGSMLLEFEAGLVGAAAGTEKVVEVNFPEDYPGQAVAGKTAEFKIHVKAVAVPRLPEIDEEFIKGLGVESGTEADLRAEVRTNLEREMKERVRTTVRARVLERLSALNDIEVPGQVVDEELDRMVESTRARFAQQGLKDMPVDRERLLPEARRRVALGLIVHEVVRANEIKVDDAQLRARVEEMAASYEQPEEFVRWHFADRSRLANIEGMVLEEQVVEFLLGSANVKDEKVSFQDLVSTGQA